MIALIEFVFVLAWNPGLRRVAQRVLLSALNAALLSGVPLHAFAQQSEKDDADRTIAINSALNHDLLDHNYNLRKVDILLDARSSDRMDSGHLFFGASLIGIMDFQRSNRNSKFSYLMRHPTPNNQIGKSASEAVLHSAQLMVAGSVLDWLTVYSEVLYDPEQSFGAGTITTLTRNQLQLRKGYLLLGNLSRFPLYGALGKMDVNFGETGSVSPFTNSTMWHAFGGLGYGALAGMTIGGLNASFTAVQGGAQFRSLNVPVDSTIVPSRLNNFVADANYTVTAGESGAFKLGASYVRGTSYCQGFPVVHFEPCDKSNPAATAYADLRAFDRILVKAAYARTRDVWPGTFNPNPPLNEFAASNVSSLSLGASIAVRETDLVRLAISGEFSNFVAGPEGAPWERQDQWVAGLCATLKSSSRLFLEAFRTTGYAPLNFVSGGNLPDPGATHSDAGARSFGIVLGAQVTL